MANTQSTKLELDLEHQKPNVAHIDEFDHVDAKRVDKEILQYAAEQAVVIDEQTNTRLKRKIDRRVLPVMVITYFLQALDKGTLSFASIMGIKEETGLVGQDYQWLTTCTYLAVLIWEFPTNWIVQRVPIGKYLSFNIIAWSISLAAHAACKNFTHLVVVRTLLGIFECSCQPIFVVLSSMWYRREEQAATVAFWYMMNGGQQIVGGILAYCFTLIQHARIYNWQILFLTYGCLSVVWGAFVGYYMPDSPMRAKCFSEEDKTLMVERVRSNQTGLQNRHFRREQLFEALRDPQCWAYPFIQFFTALPTSGLGAFANIIISSFGFSILHTQLLAMVLGAYLIVILLGSAYLSRKLQQNIYLMIGFVIPSIIGTVVLMTVVNDNTVTRRAALLFCYYLTLSFWASSTLGLSMLSRNVAGQTKKTCAIAMNFVGWAVGNTVGPQVFRTTDAPRYIIAFAVHMGCYGLLIIMLVFLRIWLKRQNTIKDQKFLDGDAIPDIDLTHAFEDLTDMENPNFRYQF
ncbi:major facilitator superfamily domain-containing protein [Kockiozyma suomiensis]|uniref:major facilitator superfamily domain-containing protein n=1 Tax=Kockiozyma suomiensis TaxID=1337062 RepID=UPI00334329F6